MIEKRLGRGLDSLITSTTETPAGLDRVLDIPVDDIVPNPNQPRWIMNEKALESLAASISLYGVLQPVVVRRSGSGYELVAGERRVRASRLAGQSHVRALIVEADSTKSLEIALIENIQRENLGPLEEAAAYEALISQSEMTHQELAGRVGKGRAAVTNALRLLDLPEKVKDLVNTSRLSAGQARALLGAGSPGEIDRLAGIAVQGHWSVREVERRVKRSKATTKKAPPAAGGGGGAKYEEELRNLYGTKVEIKGNEKRGDVRLHYYSESDRDRLLHFLIEGARRFAGGEGAKVGEGDSSS